MNTIIIIISSFVGLLVGVLIFVILIKWLSAFGWYLSEWFMDDKPLFRIFTISFWEEKRKKNQNQKKRECYGKDMIFIVVIILAILGLLIFVASFVMLLDNINLS